VLPSKARIPSLHRARRASYSYAKRMYVNHSTLCRGARRLPLEERMVTPRSGCDDPLDLPPPGYRLVRPAPHWGLRFPHTADLFPAHISGTRGLGPPER
jgi:hypothetical protein